MAKKDDYWCGKGKQWLEWLNREDNVAKKDD